MALEGFDESLAGKWLLVKNEGFDEYLAAMGMCIVYSLTHISWFKTLCVYILKRDLEIYK